MKDFVSYDYRGNDITRRDGYDLNPESSLRKLKDAQLVNATKPSQPDFEGAEYSPPLSNNERHRSLYTRLKGGELPLPATLIYTLLFLVPAYLWLHFLLQIQSGDLPAFNSLFYNLLFSFGIIGSSILAIMLSVPLWIILRLMIGLWRSASRQQSRSALGWLARLIVFYFFIMLVRGFLSGLDKSVILV